MYTVHSYIVLYIGLVESRGDNNPLSNHNQIPQESIQLDQPAVTAEDSTIPASSSVVYYTYIHTVGYAASFIAANYIVLLIPVYTEYPTVPY